MWESCKNNCHTNNVWSLKVDPNQAKKEAINRFQNNNRIEAEKGSIENDENVIDALIKLFNMKLPILKDKTISDFLRDGVILEVMSGSGLNVQIF